MEKYYLIFITAVLTIDIINQAFRTIRNRDNAKLKREFLESAMEVYREAIDGIYGRQSKIPDDHEAPSLRFMQMRDAFIMKIQDFNMRFFASELELDRMVFDISTDTDTDTDLLHCNPYEDTIITEMLSNPIIVKELKELSKSHEVKIILVDSADKEYPISSNI